MGPFDPGIVLPAGPLLLRPYAPSDALELYAAVTDAEMRRWLPWAAPDYSPRDAEDWSGGRLRADPRDGIDLAVVLAGTGRLCGGVGLHRVSWPHGRVEIGYWTVAWARGRGYAALAARAMSGYAFATGLHRVELLAATGNLASQRVAEKAGFTREAVLREAIRTPAGHADAVLFGLLAGELANGR